YPSSALRAPSPTRGEGDKRRSRGAFSPCGRRWREAPDEGVAMSEDPSDLWSKLAQKELRDTPLESLKRDYGDLPVKPAYFAEDLPAGVADAVPGVAPFTRGVRATMYANRPWTIRQYAG